MEHELDQGVGEGDVVDEQLPEVGVVLGVGEGAAADEREGAQGVEDAGAAGFLFGLSFAVVADRAVEAGRATFVPLEFLSGFEEKYGVRYFIFEKIQIANSCLQDYSPLAKRP